jgi:hypothetical protein
MKTAQWVAVAGAIWIALFAVGYAASSATGVQPGYFEAVEAGGYGGAGDAVIEGIDKKTQDYYKNLYKEEQ